MYKYTVNTNTPRGVNRTPVRRTTELAEEFGISVQRLTMVMKHHNGPKPSNELKNATSKHISYFNLFEARRWWNSLDEKVKT